MLLIGLASLIAVMALTVATARIMSARERDATVKAIQELAGPQSIVFDYQLDSRGEIEPMAESRTPKWMTRALQTDVFAEVVRISFAGNFLRRDFADPAAVHVIGTGPKAYDSEFGPFLKRMRKFSALEYLDTGNAIVRDADLERIAEFPRLRYLLTRNCKHVTDAGVAHLAKLQELQLLALNGAQIGDASLAQLSQLQRLGRLELNGAKVTDGGLRHLTNLPLVALHLRNTHITDKGLRSLGRLIHLRSLYLTNTGVTDAGLAHLRPLRKLTVLHLSGTRVTFQGAQEFEKDFSVYPIIR
jgi:hypothetical protein